MFSLLHTYGNKKFTLFSSEVSGDREVQRTMLELLNQLDGFSSDERIKVRANIHSRFADVHQLTDLVRVV